MHNSRQPVIQAMPWHITCANCQKEFKNIPQQDGQNAYCKPCRESFFAKALELTEKRKITLQEALTLIERGAAI